MLQAVSSSAVQSHEDHDCCPTVWLQEVYEKLQAGLWHQNEEKEDRKWIKMYKQHEEKNKERDKD